MADRGIDDNNPSRCQSKAGVAHNIYSYFSGDAHAKYRPQGEYEQHLRLPWGLQFWISERVLGNFARLSIEVEANLSYLGSGS